MINITKLYYGTIGHFFQGAKLYRIDLDLFNRDMNIDKLNKFKFYMPTEKDWGLFEKLYENVPNKLNGIRKRFETGNFICFAYQAKKNSRLVYARWICKNKYYSDVMRKQLKFTNEEAITLDSYTHPDYRFLGLHKNMNILMLQWLKSNTQIRYVYMVILMFILHLTKIPLEIGYNPIESTFYYKKGSVSAFLNLLKRKLNFYII